MDLSEIQARAAELEQQISALPAGSITKKTVSGKDYFYHRWTENKKRREKYIPADELENFRAQIERRKAMEQELHVLEKQLPKAESANPSAFTTNVRTGEALRSFAASVRGYQNVEEYLKALPSLDKDTHAFSSDATFASVVLTLTGSPPRCGASSSPHKVLRPCGGPMCKSALTASSSLAYASMPASSSLPSSDFPSPKSPVEFLRGRNAVGGSAAKMAGWRLPMNRAMPYGIYARKNRMCSCQTKVTS